MKSTFTLVLLASFFCTQVSLAKTGIALGDILQKDGTIGVKTGLSGTIDFEGYRVVLDSCAGPVFFPATVAPGWNALGSGLSFQVYTIVISGSDIYAGGIFNDAGGNANADNIARWNGSTWNALGSGLDDAVRAIAISGSSVYAGGDFTDAGGDANADRIARWNGSSWNALGAGMNLPVFAIAISGSDVYAGGLFTDGGGNSNADYIARWNGCSWIALGTGLNEGALAIAISGSNVYVAGQFTDAGGNVNADYIARWNGSSWNALGTGLDWTAWAVAIDGSNIYVGGFFFEAGGVVAPAIARWDGSNWNALGTGTGGSVVAIAISGSDVYAGGSYSNMGGNSNANYVARWNGSSWNALGSGLDNDVSAIAITGSDVYVGGFFTNAGGNPAADKIARWENGPLPVELIEITAHRKGNIINLTWRTASETQNDHFHLQHSTDGHTFHDLAQIPGHGNSLQENSYEYLHENPSPGINYYRLKQVDFDGGFEFSNVISVNMENDDYEVHPNPTSGILQITGREDIAGGEYFVKDSMGRLLQSGRLEGMVIDISGLNAGVYLLEIKLNERLVVKRVVRH